MSTVSKPIVEWSPYYPSWLVVYWSGGQCNIAITPDGIDHDRSGLTRFIKGYPPYNNASPYSSTPIETFSTPDGDKFVLAQASDKPEIYELFFVNSDHGSAALLCLTPDGIYRYSHCTPEYDYSPTDSEGRLEILR